MKSKRFLLERDLYLCEHLKNPDYAWIAIEPQSFVTNDRAVIRGCKLAATRGYITVNEAFTCAIFTPLGKAMMKLTQ